MHRQRRLLRTALGGMVVLIAITVGAYLFLGRDTAARGGAVPAGPGIYLGVYAPNSEPGRYDTTVVQALEARIGRRFAIDQHYYSWTDPFPTDLEPTDRAAGRIPMITWLPDGVSLADIAAGRSDTLLRARAAAGAAFATPVLLRLAHEPNGDWYTWSAHYDRGRPIPGNTAASY